MTTPWVDDSDLPDMFLSDQWERICVDGGTYQMSRPLFTTKAAADHLTWPHGAPDDVRVGDLVRLDDDRNVLELRRVSITSEVVALPAPLALAEPVTAKAA